VEYGGNANVTKSGYACSRWTDVAAAQPDSKFPDGSRAAAGNQCRNPTGDPGGPWCYVAVDRTTVQDYCETNGCDDDDGCDWTLVNGDGVGHGHYSTLTATASSDASFELKVWDTAAMARDVKPFRVSLSAYPVDSGPSGGDGFEVPVPVRSFVGSVRSVRVQLSWRHGFVVLTAGPTAEEVLSFDLNAIVSPVAYVSFVGDRTVPVSVRYSRCDQTEGASVFSSHVF